MSEMMEYRFLGDMGVAVPKLAFGTMSFGDDADETMSRALFERCREAGINFFDCADVYQNGRSESCWAAWCVTVATTS